MSVIAGYTIRAWKQGRCQSYCDLQAEDKAKQGQGEEIVC